MNLSYAAIGALYILTGVGLGKVYFDLVAHTVHLHTEGRSSSLLFSFYLLRTIASVIVFWLVAQQGAMPLLLLLFGFVLVRLFFQNMWEFNSNG